MYDDVSGDLFNDSLEFRESTREKEDRPRHHPTQTEEKG